MKSYCVFCREDFKNESNLHHSLCVLELLKFKPLENYEVCCECGAIVHLSILKDHVCSYDNEWNLE